MSAAVIIGTGPSLTGDQVNLAIASGLPIYVGNLAYQLVPDADVFFACNYQFWDYYWHHEANPLKAHPAEKWTWNKDVAKRYGVNHVTGRWEPSLSTDRNFIHYGHGTGYEILGVAYNLGVRTMILIGYDLKYPDGYNYATREPGGKRHYFGEYPPELQHWPGSNIVNGVLNGLLNMYATIDCEALGLRIINCTPGSMLTRFENAGLEETLGRFV